MNERLAGGISYVEQPIYPIRCLAARNVTKCSVKPGVTLLGCAVGPLSMIDEIVLLYVAIYLFFNTGFKSCVLPRASSDQDAGLSSYNSCNLNNLSTQHYDDQKPSKNSLSQAPGIGPVPV